MSAKLHFSQQEKDLVTSTDWILTKLNISKKIYDFFAELYKFQKEKINTVPCLSAEIYKTSGKIYKGENYRGLPYIVLDHPAIFKKNDLFVIRTMFWWGNFFSITLHLSGTQQSSFTNNASETLEFLQRKNFFICVNKDEWQHHFENDNYINANEFTIAEFIKIMEKSFFKVSKKISIAEEEIACDFLRTSFEEIITVININYQAGEKVLSLVSPTTGSGL